MRNKRVMYSCREVWKIAKSQLSFLWSRSLRDALYSLVPHVACLIAMIILWYLVTWPAQLSTPSQQIKNIVTIASYSPGDQSNLFSSCNSIHPASRWLRQWGTSQENRLVTRAGKFRLSQDRHPPESNLRSMALPIAPWDKSAKHQSLLLWERRLQLDVRKRHNQQASTINAFDQSLLLAKATEPFLPSVNPIKNRRQAMLGQTIKITASLWHLP